MEHKDKLWMEAYYEVMGESFDEDDNLITVSQYMKHIGPIPDESLLMGKVLGDGLPLMLNLQDPAPRSILMTTNFDDNFIPSIAVSASHCSKTKLGIITHRPQYWSKFSGLIKTVGIFPVHSRDSDNLILSLASWAYGTKFVREYVILLFDEINHIDKMEVESIQNLRWLLKNGASRGVWVIASAKSSIGNLKNEFLTHFTGTSESIFTFDENGRNVEAQILEPE